MRQLLMKIDPNNVPKTRLASWNVGSRVSQLRDQSPVPASIMDLLSHAQMTSLAYVYFEKIDPCYGFIDREAAFQHINSRWHLPPYALQSYDAVLCGIAALGSYFSRALAIAVEPQLVQLARSILDSTSPFKAPDADNVTAWVCHVIYLRFTAAPFTAWIASCTTMHIFEAAGIHLNAHGNETFLAQSNTNQLAQMSRRAFGVAQHLNTWISYDMGLSRVSLQGPPILPASIGGGDYTEKLLELLPISLGLDRVASQDDSFLRPILAGVVAKTDDEPPLIMAQCNLILCILRQLHIRNSLRVSEDHALDSALHFLAKGFRAARRMIKDDCPWHHLANIPFQTLCMLLAIDTPKSLGMVGDAIQILQEVTTAYNTTTLNEAYSTACMVLCLHRKRRLDDTQIIDNVLSRLIDNEDTTLNIGKSATDRTTLTETEVAWFNDLMGEFPSLQNFDAGDVFNDPLTNQIS